MKAYRESGGTKPLILNLSTRRMMNGQPHILAALPPEKQPPVSTKEDSRWAPRACVDIFKKRKSLFKTSIVQALV
jgi:hypothetical protein